MSGPVCRVIDGAGEGAVDGGVAGSEACLVNTRTQFNRLIFITYKFNQPLPSHPYNVSLVTTAA